MDLFVNLRARVSAYLLDALRGADAALGPQSHFLGACYRIVRDEELRLLPQKIGKLA